MRAVNPITIAIREGIGKRLLELGFQRQGARMYLKETGDYSEWVHFGNRPGGFTEQYGVFDNGLQRYMDCLMPDGFPTGHNSGPKLLHFGMHAYHFGAYEAAELEKQWRRRRRPWRPLEYFIEPPRNLTPYRRYISDQFHGWTLDDDPHGCAAATLEAFEGSVGRWRADMATDAHKVARIIGTSSLTTPVLKIVARAYAGDFAGAEELIQHYVATKDDPPSKQQLSEARRREALFGMNMFDYERSRYRNKEELAVLTVELGRKIGIKIEKIRT